jgi:hypothetical protein
MMRTVAVTLLAAIRVSLCMMKNGIGRMKIRAYIAERAPMTLRACSDAQPQFVVFRMVDHFFLRVAMCAANAFFTFIDDKPLVTRPSIHNSNQ